MFTHFRFFPKDVKEAIDKNLQMDADHKKQMKTDGTDAFVFQVDVAEKFFGQKSFAHDETCLTLGAALGRVFWDWKGGTAQFTQNCDYKSFRFGAHLQATA